MKTVEIQTNYEHLIVAYQLCAYTRKGEISYGCASMSLERIAKRNAEMNERAPFYCDIYDTVIYETFIRELAIRLH